MALGRKTGGRQKGTPNKTTKALKDMILEALDRKGGADYLERLADDEPVAFAGLLGKVLPMQITGEGGGALEITWRKPDAS
jgi:hypothetical protein